MATQPVYELLSAAQFLEIDFGVGVKAELDHGTIRMMVGGSAIHARVQSNVSGWLRTALRGTGCRPFGPDMGVRTHNLSVRYSDVSVFCGRDDAAFDNEKAFDDPRVIFEILSGSTACTDLRVKLEEYKMLPSIDTIVFVDTVAERVRIVQRTGPGAWSDVRAMQPQDVDLPSVNAVVPHSEIFARD